MSNSKNTNNSSTIDSDTWSIDSITTKSSHLSFAQIRGLIKLFNYYFVIKDSHGRNRRLPRNEINKRWTSYKKKVFEDYGKVIKGTLNSEKAFVKRYSNPLSFLKYKLKRSTNLKIEDLSQDDRSYYFEIGGMTDIQELIKQQSNVDSINTAVDRIRKRPRIYSLPPSEVQILSTDSIPASVDIQPGLMSTQSTLPPPVVEPKQEESKFSAALNNLDEKLTVYEQEQLEKKKTEINELFQEKCKVIMANFKTCLQNHPELIGFIPFCPAEDQMTNAFDNWLHQHVTAIKAKVKDVDIFLVQICTLRSDGQDWTNFIHAWKLQRIFFEDDFTAVWNWIVKELNVDTKSDKQEADADIL